MLIAISLRSQSELGERDRYKATAQACCSATSIEGVCWIASDHYGRLRRLRHELESPWNSLAPDTLRCSLRSFKIDEIKIDKQFVQGIRINEGDAAIVSAILGLCRSENPRGRGRS